MSKINCLWNTCFSWIILLKDVCGVKIPFIDEGFENEEMPKEETVVTQDLADSPGPPPGNAEPSPSGELLKPLKKLPQANQAVTKFKHLSKVLILNLHRATLKNN